MRQRALQPTGEGEWMKDDFQAHGYNEAFTIAPNLGVGHFSVPIKLSPGRDGFHPELALSHGSAASNGDFGLGWSIDIPHISRRTSQGVPTYDDEQDVFVYSLDELTPKLDDHGAAVTSTQDGYCQTEFVPQVAHSPVRIERFISVNDCNDSFWRVTTANNVTHTFGSEPSSQIYDAALFAKSGLKQVFAWLLDYSYDARGNAILYNYASETTDGIDASAPFEQNRSSEMISSYRHPIGIKYGNIIPNRDLETWSVCRRSQLDQTRGWLFEIAFDYGQFPLDVSPTTQVLTPTGGASAWACRPDPFSSHRCGFELRNNRLCDRILMFHHFPDEFGQEDLLVSATVLNYQLVNGASTLQSLRHTGYLTDPSDSTKFVQSSLPPMCFEYADSVLTADPEIKTMPGNHFAQSPVQLVDVNGDGSLGLFAQHADSWYYQPSSGAESSFEDNAWVPISEIPGHLAHDGQLDDIDGDGLVNLTRLQGPTGGFYGRSNQGAWQSFQAFENQIHLPDGGGYSLLRQMDLTGDGLPDLLCAANDFIVWYKSLGQQGHGESRYCFVGVDEVSGPRSVVQSSSEAIFVADMTGDGLLDLVRVSHSAVCYWPSQGHGRFGHQVIMGNSPLLGSYDLFSPHRVILSNISGNGCADLVYFSADGDRSWASVCYNIAGNTWSDLVDINGIPAMDNSTEFFVADLFGSGARSLVWVSPKSSQIFYINMTDGTHPRLLTRITNGSGLETRVSYKSSSEYAREDASVGSQWHAKFPLSIMCVSRLETFDRWRNSSHVQTFRYRNAYFDRHNRDFRGFAFSEQTAWDDIVLDPSISDERSVRLATPKNVTRTWYHTGEAIDPKEYLNIYCHDTFTPAGISIGGHAITLEEFMAAPSINPDTWHWGVRALSGQLLRVEKYFGDGSNMATTPVDITCHSVLSKQLQHEGANADLAPAVFWPLAIGTLVVTLNGINDGDARISQTLVLSTDSFFNVTARLSVEYGRFQSTADISPKAREAAAVQLAPIVVLTYNEYTLGLIDNESLLVPHIWQTRSFQLTGAVGIGGDASLMDPSRDLGELLVELDAYPQVDFETDMYSPEADWKTKSKRMFSHKTYSYYHDDLTTSSSTTQPEQVGPLVLLAYTQTKAISEGLLQSVLGEKMDESSGIFSTSKEMQKAGYYKDADDDWVFKTTSNGYVSDDERGREKHSARARFFTPVFFRDPLNNETVIEHDKYALFAVRVTNALQEQTTKLYDYRVLKVKHTIDANRNRETNIYDALGRLVGQPLVSKVAPGAESKSPEAKEEILLGGNYEGDGHANDNFLESIVDAAPAVLGVLASRIVRQANTSSDSSTPPWEAHITRQLPMVKNSESTAGMIQITVLYMDGFMSILQTKHFRGNGQWWTSAWATKAPGAGSAVKIFQPFLSTTVAAELRPHGFAATFCKDGTGKDLGQVNRDRSWTKTIHHPWYAAEYSRGDLANVSVPTEDIDIGHQLLSLCSQDELPWTLQERQDQSSDEVNVQNKAYANTPTMIHFSPNGSTVAIQESLGETIPSLTTVQLSEGTSQLIRRQRDPRGVGSESLVLDMIGHAIHQRLADSGDRWSIYDALGRVTWTWDSRHSVFCQEYDKVGRKTRLWWSKTDKATPNMIPIESIKYGDGIDRAADLNLVGRVHEIRDQSGIFRITSRDQHYNGLSTEQTLRESPSSWNSVEDETTADLSKEKVTFSFTFDLQNRLMSQKGYSGTLVEYAYNLSGLLTSVHATCVGQETPFPIISGTEYDEFWQKTAVKYGNGTWTRHVFDERTGQLMQRATISSRDQSMIEGDLFDYDADGNIVSITELLPSSGGDTKVGAIRQRAYYDALHRLIGSTGRQELNVGKASENFVDFKERFSYDDSGNMTGSETGYSGDDMSSVVETLSYSESDNRLVSIKRTGNTGDNDNTSTLSYDAHGNITGGLTSGQAFEWDGKDQLVSTTMENTVSSYVYDYDGERTHKVTIESERKKTIEECKYYAFGLERRVMDVEGQPVQHDIQTIRLPPNTAAHDDVLATVEASSSGDVPASLNVKLLDHLGSVLTEIDRDGRSQMQSREYSAFGKVVAGSDGAPLDNRGFQGKERDGASGLQYHSRRYYSVELRRWISPDPLGVADGLNGYLFVGNNPVNYRDPQGLMMKSSADRNRDDEEEDKRNSGRKRFFDESSHGKEQSGRKMRTGKKGNKDKQREEQGQRLAAMYDAYYGPIWPPRLEEEFGKYRRPETEPQRNQVPARLLVPSHGPLRFAQQAQPLRVQQAPPQRGGPQAPLGGGPPVGGVPAAAPGRGPPVAPGRGPPAAPGRGPPVAPGRGPPAAAPGGGLPVAPVPGRGPPGPGPGAGPLAPGPGGGPLVAAPWRGPGAGRGRGRGIHIVIPPGFVPGGAPGPALRALMGARGGPQQGNNYGR